MAKKINYLSNKEIMPEIVEYKRTGVASEKYGYIVLTIAQRLCTKPNFSNYTWKDDMIDQAVMTCLKYSKNFDPEKYDNPFAYLTTICYNAFQAYLNSQKKHRIIKDECYNRKHMLKDNPYTAINYEELKKYDGKKDGYKIIDKKDQNINIWKYFDWKIYKNKIEEFEKKYPNINIVYIGVYGEDKSKISAAKNNLKVIEKFNPDMNQKRIILYKIFERKCETPIIDQRREILFRTFDL